MSPQSGRTEEMIEYKDVLSMGYYKSGQPFSGSYRGMRYRIVKAETEEEGGDTLLRATVWPEPYSFENTDDALKISRNFPFSDVGRKAAVDWINESWEKGSWKTGFTMSQLRKLDEGKR